MIFCLEVSKLTATSFRSLGSLAMRRLNFFSLFYLVTAAAFAAISFTQLNLEAGLTAGFSLLCAVLNLFSWWQQVIIEMGKKGSLVFDAVAIAIALVIQAYGLISSTFGFSYLIIGFIILTLVSTVEDAVVLQGAERRGAIATTKLLP